MQPRLLKSSQKIEFVPAMFDGINRSGYAPLGDHVLVAMDQASDTTGGGIALLPEQVERSTLAAETGIVIAVGPGAFSWSSDRARPFEGRKPAPGDRVYIQRFAGQVIMGEDGAVYRVLNDVCVAAVHVGSAA